MNTGRTCRSPAASRARPPSRGSNPNTPTASAANSTARQIQRQAGRRRPPRCGDARPAGAAGSAGDDKVVVFNNGALSFVELEMKAAGIVTYGTDLDNPDFAGIARAAGLFGARVEKPAELEDALRAAFGHDGPALVDVHTDRYELALPPKLSYGEVKGFTLYATRTVLSGEGKELVELAKTNLRELDIE